MRADRIALLALALLAVGCTSGRGAVGSRGPTPQPTSSPTLTFPPAATQGVATRPIPAGTNTVVVTFLRASDSFATPPPDVLFRRTVQAPGDVKRIVDAVNALRVASTATQGCVASSVNLRLDFIGVSGTATLEENSPCFRSILVVDGKAGPTLASNLASRIEQMFGVAEVTTSAGQPSIAPSAASSS